MVDTEVNMIPSEALKMIKRLRSVGPCKIGLHIDAQLPTSDGRSHTYPTLLDNVTVQQASHFLEDVQRIHDTMREVSDTPPLVHVKIYEDDENKRKKSVVIG